MTRIRRLLLMFAALALFAAACGDDTDTISQEAVDQLLEDDDPEPDPEPEPERSSSDPEETVEEAESQEAEEEADEPEPEEPAGPTVTDACLLLRHYNTGLFPAAPYQADILFDLASGAEAAVAGATHPDPTIGIEAMVFPGAAESPAGGTISWEVWAPGPVDMPDSITVDGEEISDQIYDGFFGGERSFVAASAEIRDEELIVVPCEIPYMVMVDPGSLG